MKTTRRDLGWVVTRALAVAGGNEFFADWLRADHGSSHAPPEPDRWSNYKPKFFSAEEFKMLSSFTEILIPTDDTPGAREAHVAHFIDFVVNAAAEYAPEMQDQWRSAMEALRKQNFGGLSVAEQTALIQKMGEKDQTYRLIKAITIRAFYSSRAGLVEALEYKGNAYLTEFPACTHPEHRRV